MVFTTERLFTLEELSRHLRVNQATIYRLAREGKIPGAKVGRQWRFDKKQISKWLKENQNSNNKTQNK